MKPTDLTDLMTVKLREQREVLTTKPYTVDTPGLITGFDTCRRMVAYVLSKNDPSFDPEAFQKNIETQTP